MNDRELQLEQEWRKLVIDSLNEIKREVGAIKIQTTETNGRVNVLEAKHSLCPVNKMGVDIDFIEKQLAEGKIPVSNLVIEVQMLKTNGERMVERIELIENSIDIIRFFKNYPKAGKFLFWATIVIILTMLGINVTDIINNKLF